MVLKLNGGRNVVFPQHNLIFIFHHHFVFPVRKQHLSLLKRDLNGDVWGFVNRPPERHCAFCENWKKPQFISSRNSTK